VAGIIALGVGFGFWAGHGLTGQPPTTPPVSNVDANPPSTTMPTDTQPMATSNPLPQTNLVVEPQPIVPLSASNVAVATNLTANTNWEDKIDDIVGSDDPDTNKVKQL